jgi:hypothetical protein
MKKQDSHELVKIENEQLQHSFQNTNKHFEVMNNNLSTAGVINNIANVFQAMKQIDADIKMMDMRLQAHINDSNIKLEAFKAIVPTISKQLDSYSNNINNILDKALAIDTKTSTPEEIQLRGQLLNQVSHWGDTVSTLMMKLMSF